MLTPRSPAPSPTRCSALPGEPRAAVGDGAVREGGQRSAWDFPPFRPLLPRSPRADRCPGGAPRRRRRGTLASCDPGSHQAPHTPGVLSFLAELLLDPSGLFDGWRDRRPERRYRRRALAAGIPCALRVVEGAHPGLRRRWRRGAARVPPGALVFDPASRGRQRMTVFVRSATLQQPWDIPRRAPRGVGPRPRRIVLTTAQSTLEWLVPEEQVERAMGVARTRAPTRRDC